MIDTGMFKGDEFRLADEFYHLPPGVEWPGNDPAKGPRKVNQHGHCAACDALTASQPLQLFRDAFASASVKVDESDTFKLISRLKELHQTITKDATAVV